MQKALRIFLLVLIIIGIILLFTQKTWVPKLVNKIISSETSRNPVLPVPTSNQPDKTDLIRVSYPLPNQIVSSPLVIEGVARGSWFFEATFPVVLTNWDGLIIAEGVARAESDWMTSNFVPFKAKLDFTIDKKSYSDKGTLILRKDNPSGLAKNNDSLEIPVIFAGTTN